MVVMGADYFIDIKGKKAIQRPEWAEIINCGGLTEFCKLNNLYFEHTFSYQAIMNPVHGIEFDLKTFTKTPEGERRDDLRRRVDIVVRELGLNIE